MRCYALRQAPPGPDQYGCDRHRSDLSTIKLIHGTQCERRYSGNAASRRRGTTRSVLLLQPPGEEGANTRDAIRIKAPEHTMTFRRYVISYTDAGTEYVVRK